PPRCPPAPRARWTCGRPGPRRPCGRPPGRGWLLRSASWGRPRFPPRPAPPSWCCRTAPCCSMRRGTAGCCSTSWTTGARWPSPQPPRSGSGATCSARSATCARAPAGAPRGPGGPRSPRWGRGVPPSRRRVLRGLRRLPAPRGCGGARGRHGAHEEQHGPRQDGLGAVGERERRRDLLGEPRGRAGDGAAGGVPERRGQHADGAPGSGSAGAPGAGQRALGRAVRGVPRGLRGERAVHPARGQRGRPERPLADLHVLPERRLGRVRARRGDPPVRARPEVDQGRHRARVESPGLLLQRLVGAAGRAVVQSGSYCFSSSLASLGRVRNGRPSDGQLPLSRSAIGRPHPRSRARGLSRG
ncbi:unnamed protein product, partial [Prorocentrum cordatum]